MKILIYKKNNFVNMSGGVEKVVCNFANEMCERGHQVSVLTRDENIGQPFFPLDSKVEYIQIEIPKFNWFRKLINRLLFSKYFTRFQNGLTYFDREFNTSKILKETIDNQNPDVVLISGFAELVDIYHKQEYTMPVILMVHSLPSIYFKGRRKKNNILYHQNINKITLAQVLLPSYVDILQKYYQGKIITIGNAIDVPKEMHKEITDKKIIIFIGRISHDKNQTLLIDAFSKIHKNFSNWEVHLFGAGKQLAEVKKQISNLKLQDKVKYCGTTQNPLQELYNSDICAFPSVFEGFPLALSEAMAVGLPCLGLKTASGVNELIKDGENGFLAENDTDDFAKKLATLMSDEALREKIGKQSKADIQAYRPKIIWDKWEEVLKQITNQ